jgi:hypothetical protein
MPVTKFNISSWWKSWRKYEEKECTPYNKGYIQWVDSQHPLLNGKNETIMFEFMNESRMSSAPLLFSTVTECSVREIRQEKTKGYIQRSQTIPICRWYDHVIKRLKILHQNSLREDKHYFLQNVEMFTILSNKGNSNKNDTETPSHHRRYGYHQGSKRRIPRWRLEVGSRKRPSYSEILERCWRHTLQA